MKIIHILFLLVITSVVLTAQHNKKDHKQVDAIFVALVTSELALTPEESQSFWPVYNKYRAEHAESRKKSQADFSNVTSDEQAERVLQEMIDLDRKRLDLQTQLYSDLSGIISPTQILKLKSSEHAFRRKMFNRMKGKWRSN